MITIRAPHPSDNAPLHAALTRPAVLKGTLQLPGVHRDFLKARLEATDPNKHTIVAQWDETPVGLATLSLGTERRRHCGDLVMMFVHDAYWGRGIGWALLQPILDMADNWLGLSRLTLETDADNLRAQALYKKAGFEVEALLRADAITNGVLTDGIAMARLRPPPTYPPKQDRQP